MNKSLLAACLVAASLPSLAADPADAAVPVPPVEYRSVLRGQPTGVEQETVDWKKANAAVAEFPRGHIDLLKWEERQAPTTPAAPAPANAPAAAPRGHRH